jgi:hypothetical protein
MICIISFGNLNDPNQGSMVDSVFGLENPNGDKTFSACI